MSGSLRITAQESGERIDALLARQGGMSRAAAAKLLERGLVSHAGAPLKKNARVAAGETYVASIPEPVSPEARPEDIPLAVVYEDGDLIVVDKPRGLVVHPAPGHADGTLVNALLRHCGDSLSGVGGVLRPGIVHRLDKDTGGLLIAAKNDAAHQALAAQLKDHSLARTYDAVICGSLRRDEGTVDAPIGRDPKNRKRMAVTPEHSRPAVTHWAVVARYAGYTWVRCRLETGRTHQIRVHMAHIGHPLLGDALYGGRQDKGLRSQCLTARGLRFRHPSTGEAMELWTELPDWFRDVLQKLGPEI